MKNSYVLLGIKTGSIWRYCSCEQLFSLMKNVKYKNMTRLNNNWKEICESQQNKLKQILKITRAVIDISLMNDVLKKTFELYINLLAKVGVIYYHLNKLSLFITFGPRSQ
jgi:hypothetical protein